MANHVYILIKESGSHSSFSYCILGVFTDIIEARIQRASLMYEHAKYRELAQINHSYIDNVDYIIETMEIGKMMTNNDKLDCVMYFPYPEDQSIIEDTRYKNNIERIDGKYESMMTTARQQRDQMNALRKQEQAAREEQEFHEVNQFLDWFDAGPTGDPFYQEKLQARIRSMHELVRKVALRTNDARATSFCLR